MNTYKRLSVIFVFLLVFLAFTNVNSDFVLGERNARSIWRPKS